ncbi:unnamed protein product [Dicrocoelium dendriticum]|nr:unnamed protein product [Dicrocoelium dendriticum]
MFILVPFHLLICLTVALCVDGFLDRTRIDIRDLNLCSRAESRSARHILQEIVYPLYKFGHVEIPEACPWNPRLDCYHLQELMKLQNSARDWQCNQCGKRFYSEEGIDLHMKNRHATSLYTGANSTCLASLCPILRCDVLQPDLAFGDQVFWDEALCVESRFTKLREQCENLLELCSASETEGGREVRQWLQTAICDHLSCDRYWEVPDQWPSTSSTPTFLLVALAALGIAVYYVVLVIRISSPPDSLPASSLSSPYYFQSLSSPPRTHCAGKKRSRVHRD